MHITIIDVKHAANPQQQNIFANTIIMVGSIPLSHPMSQADHVSEDE